jgi:tetratricopeptide (TPR) repeat protein
MGEVVARWVLRILVSIAGSAALVAGPAWAGPLEDANAGMAALKAGQTRSAIRLFTQAIDSGRLSPQDLELGHVERGQASLAQGDKDGARRDADDALRIDPSDAEARQLWWNTDAQAGNADADWGEAWKCAKSDAASPGSLTVYLDRTHRWVRSPIGEHNRPLALRVSGPDLMWKWHIEGIMGQHDRHSDGSIYFDLDTRMLAVVWKDDQGKSGAYAYACSTAP